ncbi:HAD-IA family hydrolase [Candidatus Bathyarchaeota archaeon]|nr:HAD-IA family hydrolase [Candidatus Bathyarchaeota archaeon]
MIRAVLFDLGGTLIETAEIPEIFRRILKVFGITVSYEEIFNAHEACKKEFDVAAGQIKLGMEFWTEYNSEILRKLGIKHNVKTLAENISKLWWDNADLRFYPDVIDAVGWLKDREIKVGVITNALKEDYEQILQRLNATCLFDVVVGTDACKKAKPNRQIFMCALDMLDVKPEDALFVGNDLETDYHGALKAGLKALLIDRDGKNKGEVETIATLKEMLLHIR